MTTKTLRVKLRYTRKVTQTERGHVYVDVPSNGTMADAYRIAYDKEFVEYLPKEITLQNEQWHFKPAKEPVNHGRPKEPA